MTFNYRNIGLVLDPTVKNSKMSTFVNLYILSIGYLALLEFTDDY